MDKLVDMLKEMDSNHQRTLIFVETKKLADVVAGRLSDEERMPSTSMHGDESQKQREKGSEVGKVCSKLIRHHESLLSRQTSHPGHHFSRCYSPRHQTGIFVRYDNAPVDEEITEEIEQEGGVVYGKMDLM